MSRFAYQSGCCGLAACEGQDGRTVCHAIVTSKPTIPMQTNANTHTHTEPMHNYPSSYGKQCQLVTNSASKDFYKKVE